MTNKDIQKRLNARGYGPLVEDGKIGAKTLTAIKRFQKDNGLTVDGKVGPNTEAVLLADPTKPPTAGKLLSTAEIIQRYGPPGPSNLVIMELPFKMRISWDLKSFTRKIQVHRLVAPKLRAVFDEILQVYGLEEIQRLGIDLYGGVYNLRKMRGGSEWSRHSWGIAIDLDPARNPLKSSHRTAQFAKPEYKRMIEIFYKHGFVGLGPEKDYDWMHFQIGS